MVIELTCLFSSISDNLIITGINFWGKSLSKLFLKALFFSAEKSLKILLSNCSSDNAGLKSI